MRTLRRRAAVGATSLALLLAAGGTSLAAVRAARFEGGEAGSSLAQPLPNGGMASPGVPLPPTVGPFGQTPFLPEPLVPSTGLPGPADGTAPTPSAGASGDRASAPSPAGATGSSGQASGTQSPQTVSSGGTVTTLGPATGPTPTSAPPEPSATIPCPGDTGLGALPHPVGRLRALDLVLPSPGSGPLVLLPQVTAARPAGSSVRIQWASLGSIGDGSNLTLLDRLPTRYRLEAAGATADGLIAFAPLGATAEIQHRACRDRSLVVHAIAPNPGTSQLRIVGYLEPPNGTVTIDDGGGTARFRSSAPGRHQVTLLTANDAGIAGPLVRVTITVG
jgi:hypothetical protein